MHILSAQSSQVRQFLGDSNHIMCGTRTACAWKEGGQSQYLCNFAGLFPPGKASSTFETASADHQRIEKMLLSLFLSSSRSSAVCSALRRLNRNCIFFITLFSGDAEGFENHLFSRYLQEERDQKLNVFSVIPFSLQAGLAHRQSFILLLIFSGN